MTFPILISIPHGGLSKPPELDGKTCITDSDLFDDIDPYVQEIYDIGTKVKKVISANIARTFVDLNRSLQDMPPKNPDGLIKSMTCYKKPIYNPGNEPDEDTIRELIKNYYTTYHRQIQKSLSELDLQLGLDCHSMSSKAPAISPDGNEKPRPLFCISNQNGKTCSSQMLDIMGKCLQESFSIDKKDVRQNDPFRGGYITKTYGNNPVPWIQIEMSRKLYLEKPWFEKESFIMDKSRLGDLKNMFTNAVERFVAQVEF